MLQEFVEEIRKMISKGLKDIHTAFPGEIVSFDEKTGHATIKPKMVFRTPSGATIEYPALSGVPVLFQQGNGGRSVIAFPVKPGDGCLVIIAEQSLDYWLSGQVTNSDLSFDLTNAVCIPGLATAPNPIVAEACKSNAVLIQHGKNWLKINNDGVEIEGNVTVNGDLSVSGTVNK